MTTIGHAGSTEIEFTGDTEVVESFYAATEEIEVTFRFAQVLNALKAMALSTKTSLRLNEAGVMALQFIIPVDRGEMCFVEFLCLPMIAETSGLFFVPQSKLRIRS
ncbi:hypothetical protein GQ42DRAFT_154031 [Ramicandelaber brevisporus]|nr:hypothetical protein GQ42DRAFT_154031 [Ramicandelaber brevisporus]